MWEIITSISLKLLDLVHKLGERPKIDIEVNEFEFGWVENEPDSILVFISPHPSRYFARLAFSNIGKRLTTIKEIVVLVNGKLKLSPSAFEPIRLEPGEFCEKAVIFPVERSSALTQGTFEINVFDTFGKRFRYKGRFPLGSRK